MDIRTKRQSPTPSNDEGSPRTHPWSHAEDNSECRYVDFTRHPDLIEESLEDFLPFREVPAVQQFFELLRHINRPGGPLETNDCACGPITPLEGRVQGNGPQARLRFTGRLMLLLRDWKMNVLSSTTTWLFEAIADRINEFKSEAKAVVIISYQPVAFPLLEGCPVGRQIVLHWHALGDTDADLWIAFADVCSAIRMALDRTVAALGDRQG